MATRAPLLVSGIAGVLLSAGAAVAAFSGITVTFKPNEFGILTCNVYAVFTNADDRLIAVAGTADDPLSIDVVGGTFYQDPFGTDLPPNPGLFDVQPELRHDTFVTVGVKSFNGISPGVPEGALENQLQLREWPGFGASSVAGDDVAWFVTPSDDQGAAGGDLSVLLGQFSTQDGLDVTGTVLLEVISDGSGDVVEVDLLRFLVCSELSPCDLDDDGVLDVRDLLLLLGNWSPS